jgi:UDP-2,4-diacetamido-2,4,6-trideoxy-beta-L-altropyranose hydrolase
VSAVARVVIRTDATATIGAGHAMRCLALTGALRRQGAEVLLYGDVGAAIAERYAEAGATVVEPTPGEQTDRTLARNRLAVLLSSGGPAMAWAVFDGYGFDADDHAAARRAGARVLVVDDYGHLPWYGADIILNQNISADAVQYAASPDCVVLRGLRYVLLRHEFEARGGRESRRGKARAGRSLPEVLVSMGGGDSGNATLAILQALPGELLRRIRLHVLVGPHNPHRDSLLHWGQASGAQAVIHSAVRDMPTLLASMDMAVTAAGSTCWELMCMGLPFVTVVLAENQQAIAEHLDAQGLPGAGDGLMNPPAREPCGWLPCCGSCWTTPPEPGAAPKWPCGWWMGGEPCAWLA